MWQIARCCHGLTRNPAEDDATRLKASLYVGLLFLVQVTMMLWLLAAWRA
jgi:hypothetical protein